MKHHPARGPNGTLLQAAMPKRTAADLHKPPPVDRKLKAVVINTYVHDDAAGVTAIGAPASESRAVYCELRCYGRYRSRIPRALVLQERNGLQDGDLWIPRPSRRNISGAEFDPWVNNPGDLDGDHVVVEFLEHDPSQPVITRALPHPLADKGNTSRDLGQRRRLKDSDGIPRLWKHQGTVFGVDPAGNFLLDARRAYAGAVQQDGTEPDPAQNGAAGNFKLLLPKGSRLTLQIDGGASLTLEEKDGAAKLTLGDGLFHVAIVEHLRALWEALASAVTAQNAVDALRVCGVGPVSPAPLSFPSWDEAIASTKMALPDG